jgi:hypothetical protein
VAEGAPLLREYGLKAHRGFESLPLRHKKSPVRGFFYGGEGGVRTRTGSTDRQDSRSGRRLCRRPAGARAMDGPSQSRPPRDAQSLLLQEQRLFLWRRGRGENPYGFDGSAGQPIRTPALPAPRRGEGHGWPESIPTAARCSSLLLQEQRLFLWRRGRDAGHRLLSDTAKLLESPPCSRPHNLARHRHQKRASEPQNFINHRVLDEQIVQLDIGGSCRRTVAGRMWRE